MMKSPFSSNKRIATAASVAIAVAMFAVANSQAAESADADNTRINDRDAGAQKLTPLDQSNTSSDTAIAARIRSMITDDKSLSVNAHNVKVIVRDGAVTLRGPVENAAEKARVEAAARSVAGANAVHSEIDTKH